ncbi:Lipopolysaccharide export system protein LptA [bacterium HR15]|nr:Lipopolysaccharide export system protein LptA [bacterium HR15]
MRIVPERLSSTDHDAREAHAPSGVPPAAPAKHALLLALLMVLASLALLWGVELLRRQDPFARLARQMAQSGLQNIELRLNDAAITLREGKRMLARLQVERIDIEKSRILWHAVHLREGVFYDEQGKEMGRASATEILYNQPTRQLYITGTPTLTLLHNPILANALPLTLRAPTIRWDLRKAQITIEQPFSLEWQGGIAHAERLVLTLRDSHLRIEKGTLRLQDEQSKRREIEIEFGVFEYRGDIRKGQNLKFRDGDTTAFAPYAEVDNKRKYAIATGDLWLKDPRLDLQANKLEVWYAENQKRALLTQNVRMLIKPRESANEPSTEEQEENKLQEAKRYPVEAECGQIEYFYRKKVASITGGIKAVQRLKDGRERKLSADRAEYDQKNEILTLVGNVVLEDPDGKFKAPRLIVSAKEGEEWVRAPEGVQGTIYYTEEEEGGGSTSPH